MLSIKVPTVLQPARRRGMYEFHARECIVCHAPYWEAARLSAQAGDVPPVLRVDARTGETIWHACPHCGKTYPIPEYTDNDGSALEPAATHVPLTFAQSERLSTRSRIQCFETSPQNTGMIRTLYAGGWRWADPADLGPGEEPPAVPGWQPWSRTSEVAKTTGKRGLQCTPR
jgi:hypothetical protein